MLNKKLLTGIITGAIILFLFSPSFGQIIYGQPSAGSFRVVYSHWSLDDSLGTRKIDQFTIPLGGFIPLSDNFETRFYLASSTNKLSYLEADSSLTGLSDFRLQFSRSFSDDRFLASVGLNLPVGKKKLDPNEERAIIDVLSKNYLTFPIRRFGEGFGANLLLGGATTLGQFQCGASVAYQFNGSYTPYKGEEDYDPGDFVSFNASAETMSDNTLYSLNLIYTLYTSDKYDGDKIFKQGQQFDIRLAGAYNADKYTLTGNTHYLIRGRHTRYDITSGAVLTELKMYGNEFAVNGAFMYRPDIKWYIGPTVELRAFGGFEEIDRNVDGSTIFGFGAAYGRNFSESLAYDLGFKYYTGSAYGGDIDLTGFQVTTGLTATF